jgi:hypothetical protein
MKLRSINENLMMVKIRDALASSNYFNRPMVQQDIPWQPTSGHDNPNTEGAVTQPTGVPGKPRHRRYFGMETRPGAIRL